MNKKEAKKYGNRLYKEWLLKLTRSEITSLQKYKGILIISNYKKINSSLRNGSKRHCENEINNISAAIKKSTIDQDIICIRNSSVKFLEFNGYTINSISKGDILVEKGFMSTYLFKPISRCTTKLVLIIRVPKGTHGAYINNILPWWSGNKSEYEIIFDKDTKLQVIDKKAIRNRIYLEVEIIKNGGAC